MPSAYLTLQEAAAELNVRPDTVRKHIRAGHLGAIKLSERQTVIPRPAFNAYLRRVRGEVPAALGRALPEGTLEERVADFTAETGNDPQQWLRMWVSSTNEAEETFEQMRLAIDAFGLVKEMREQVSRS